MNSISTALFEQRIAVACQTLFLCIIPRPGTWALDALGGFYGLGVKPQARIELAACCLRDSANISRSDQAELLGHGLKHQISSAFIFTGLHLQQF